MAVYPPLNHKVTITGTLGPDIDVTTLVFEFVTKVDFRLADRVIEITHEKNNNVKIQHFDYAITATVVFSIAAGITLITIT